MKYLWLVFFLSVVFPSLGEEEVEHPLLPADTSSPRATLNTFVESCENAYDLLKNNGRSSHDAEFMGDARDAVRRIKRCMDLSEIAEFRRDNSAKEAAVSLKEVLDRIELPKEKQIPDREMMTAKDGGLIEKWTIPDTEITFQLMKEGPYEGSYLFSAYTIENSTDFYGRIKHLPYKEGATENFAKIYLTSPGSKWLAEVVKRLPASWQERKSGQAVWQWVGMTAVLILTAMAMVILYYIGRRVSRGGAEGGLFKYVLGLAFPIMAVFIPAQAQSVITDELVISGLTLHVVKFNLSLITLFAGMVVILGIGRRVGEVIVSAPHIAARSIDAQLIRVMCRLMGFSAAMVLLLQGGKHLGIPLSSLLAGAGVIGMALALSAQDVLKNVFGSIMLIMDKPFSVGERIKVKGYDGVVEEIGLRSTKIRLLNGHQASIPNEAMARDDIENVGRRPFIRRVSKIRLPVDIGSAQAEASVKIIEDLLKDHEGLNAGFPPRVWVNDFEDDHLELKMMYWYHPPEYWEFTKHADWVNREILSRFEAAGISIALPSFTTKVDDESGSPVIPPQS
ncbi:mechanosensitive ion channel family protein [Pontiellaceae bacterium B12227]|nr:mechanosensitive ion channel family protein [Pontiellaceae bacterium B12227]